MPMPMPMWCDVMWCDVVDVVYTIFVVIAYMYF
jgi:hypothetical protein